MLEVNDVNLKLFTEKIIKYKDVEGPLVPMLHIAQNMFGYIPKQAQNIIEDEYNLSNAFISGVASFYEMFYLEPTGLNHIGVCTGTTCHINGSKKILNKLENVLSIKNGETTDDGQFTIVPVKCIGNCDMGPNITVNNKVFNKVTVDDVIKIVKDYKNK